MTAALPGLPGPVCEARFVLAGRKCGRPCHWHGTLSPYEAYPRADAGPDRVGVAGAGGSLFGERWGGAGVPLVVIVQHEEGGRRAGRGAAGGRCARHNRMRLQKPAQRQFAVWLARACARGGADGARGLRSRLAQRRPTQVSSFRRSIEIRQRWQLFLRGVPMWVRPRRPRALPYIRRH
jgi:hypothetical protein